MNDTATMEKTTTAPATSAPAPVPATSEPKLRRWDPLALLGEMQAEFDRFFGPQAPFRPLRRLAELPTAWAPRADVFEQGDRFVVKAELPGVPKDQIDVTVENGDLVIRGERQAEEKVEEKDYYRMERSYGSFYRRLPLPEGVTPEQIEAAYTDGVLEVRVPKPAAAPEPKRIPIA